ncbi:hypothetical protein [Salinibacter ruber]|uniref:hypothetical protein n=1 Tax=Salinibacter ruber TaxID=146919 RepID=UPI0021680CCB|nr:hypothetical protein [Salinibacter ruber]MCS3698092.1 hypothetical protein [Salinibacter ruber]
MTIEVIYKGTIRKKWSVEELPEDWHNWSPEQKKEWLDDQGYNQDDRSVELVDVDPSSDGELIEVKF